jgi:hypothetical protein
LYLLVTHNKKAPVEQETGAIPLIIDAAKATYDQYNSLADVYTMVIIVLHQATFEEIFG